MSENILFMDQVGSTAVEDHNGDSDDDGEKEERENDAMGTGW